MLFSFIAVTAVASPQQQILPQDFSFLSLLKHGGIRPAPDLLRLLGPVPDSKTFTMSTFVLYGTLHGRFGGLRQTLIQMSRTLGRTLNSLQLKSNMYHKQIIK